MLAGLSMLVLAAAFLLMNGYAYHEYTTSEGPSQMARIAIMPQGITNPTSTRMKRKNTNTTNIASLIVRPVNASIIEMPRPATARGFWFRPYLLRLNLRPVG